MKRQHNFVRLLKVGVFIITFFTALHSIYNLLSFKYGDGILAVKKMYELKKDSVDILVLGSSHAFEDINTGILFESYGLASYIMGGSAQPYWNSYYYLIEALKTQRPQLVILEAYASTYDFEYADHSVIIKNNLGIKSLTNLYDSIKASAPAESFDDYWFNYRWWHSRYTELSEADYRKFYDAPLYKYFKGFGINFATTALEMPLTLETEGTLPLAKKTEEYYRKIIELTIRNKIPLLIVASPYAVNVEAQKQFNQSSQIAKEYGVDFINFNNMDYYDLMGLDFSTDFADPDHLNYLGNVKYTNLLADLILEKYNIPNRKDDVQYDSWRLHSKEIRGRVENYDLSMETEFGSYLKKLEKSSEDYTIIILTITNTSNLLSIYNLSSELGIKTDELRDGCMYVIENNQMLCQFTDLSWEYKKLIDTNELMVSRRVSLEDNTLMITHSLKWNGREYIEKQIGTYILVYDNFSQSLVDICCFNKQEGTFIKE